LRNQSGSVRLYFLEGVARPFEVEKEKYGKRSL